MRSARSTRWRSIAMPRMFGGPLQERQVVLGELAGIAAVDLEYAAGLLAVMGTEPRVWDAPREPSLGTTAGTVGNPNGVAR